MTKKKITLFLCLLFFILSFMSFSFSGQRAPAKQRNVLEKIALSKSERTLEVKILLTVFSFYRQFELSNPNRLVIDFIDVSGVKAFPLYKVNDFGVAAIRTGMPAGNTARVVFDMMREIPPYRIESIPNGLKVIFGEEEAPVVIPVKPKVEDAICALKVEPSKANINDSVAVDMSGSQYAQSMEVQVFNPEGTVVESKKLSPESPRWETKFNTPGEYVFRGKAFNAEGKPSENPCEAKTYINFPPVSALLCLPCEEFIGKPVSLDASGSSDADGEVVKADFLIVDEAGNIIDTYSDPEKPFAWTKQFVKEGIYTATAVVTDNFGAISEPAKVSLTIKRKKQKMFSFLVDVGGTAAKGYGTYVGYTSGRLGLITNILPKRLDFILSGGGGYISDIPGWKSFYNVDALFNLRFGPATFGFGGGATSAYKDSVNYSHGEGIINLGYDVLKISKFTSSIFIEVRGPVSAIPFEDNAKLMLGFRFVL